MEWQGKTPSTPSAFGDMPGDKAYALGKEDDYHKTLEAEMVAHAKMHKAMSKYGYENGGYEEEEKTPEPSMSLGQALMKYGTNGGGGQEILKAVNNGDPDALVAALKRALGM